MTQISESFAKQLSDLATEFNKACGAGAFFYYDSTGHDPEGFLFYDSITDFDFELGEKVDYKVYYNTETPRAICVDFSVGTESPFAKFIRRDTSLIDTQQLANGSGIWQHHDIALSSAKIHKRKKGKLVALTLAPIKKQATFPWDDDVEISEISSHHSSFLLSTPLLADATGVFYYHGRTDLNANNKHTVNFESDRIFLYSGNDKSTFTGLFLRKFGYIESLGRYLGT
ncbi:hypothetical protein CPB86DRAFT_802354 [Serendipita vermifera]|nr:hypothetical protein CPB86DRAFT_802354 [Serendipita vermifera]